jgi:hypothetical protein
MSSSRKISISYDGAYPGLCFGRLKVTVGEKVWKFPENCLHTEGYCDVAEGKEEVVQGRWKIVKWPRKFPEALKEAVEKKVNDEVPWRCCGGCI